MQKQVSNDICTSCNLLALEAKLIRSSYDINTYLYMYAHD